GREKRLRSRKVRTCSAAASLSGTADTGEPCHGAEHGTPTQCSSRRSCFSRRKCRVSWGTIRASSVAIRRSRSSPPLRSTRCARAGRDSATTPGRAISMPPRVTWWPTSMESFQLKRPSSRACPASVATRPAPSRASPSAPTRPPWTPTSPACWGASFACAAGGGPRRARPRSGAPPSASSPPGRPATGTKRSWTSARRSASRDGRAARCVRWRACAARGRGDRSETAHPARALEPPETLAGVEVRRPGVAGLDLEIERARAARPCGVCRGGEERAPDTAAAIRRLDVQLLQPHRWTAVLDRPTGCQRGDADDPAAQRRDEDGSALGVGHEPVKRCGDGGRRCRDLVLAELCHEERERGIAVGGSCVTDVWLAHEHSDARRLDEVPYSRSLCARYSATSTRPFAAPRRVLCDRATYLSPFA